MTKVNYDLRNTIDNAVLGICDGTWEGFEHATFVEEENPKDFADKLYGIIRDWLIKEGRWNNDN